MVFDVEIVLRERNYAVTERIEHGREPAAWAETDVETVLKQILLAIDRAKNRSAGSRHVTLRGFSWIVEPVDEQVVIAIEIPMGAAVAGPFAIERSRLDDDDPAGHRRRRASRTDHPLTAQTTCVFRVVSGLMVVTTFVLTRESCKFHLAFLCSRLQSRWPGCACLHGFTWKYPDRETASGLPFSAATPGAELPARHETAISHSGPGRRRARARRDR